MRGKGHYDYYLILATSVVLFCISVFCIYGMFYFKFAQINQLPVAEKILYMDKMNEVMAPFLIGLILLLGICVPKRLLAHSLAELVYCRAAFSRPGSWHCVGCEDEPGMCAYCILSAAINSTSTGSWRK